MPTKEEILKTHEDEYDKFLETGHDYGVNPIYGAMEEYAKQEAIEFNLFNLGDRVKYLGRTYEYIWDEYQKSKLKK